MSCSAWCHVVAVPASPRLGACIVTVPTWQGCCLPGTPFPATTEGCHLPAGIALPKPASLLGAASLSAPKVLLPMRATCSYWAARWTAGIKPLSRHRFAAADLFIPSLALATPYSAHRSWRPQTHSKKNDGRRRPAHAHSKPVPEAPLSHIMALHSAHTRGSSRIGLACHKTLPSWAVGAMGDDRASV